MIRTGTILLTVTYSIVYVRYTKGKKMLSYRSLTIPHNDLSATATLNTKLESTSSKTQKGSWRHVHT